MKFFFPAKTYSSSGFTLLETLVAISILITAITATFTAAQNGLSSSIEARDQVVAFYLAQEAVEMVRNIRDENALIRRDTPATSWLKGLASDANDPCFFGNSCVLDASQKRFTRCVGGINGCPNIRQDQVSASRTFLMYGQELAWTPTNFKRSITLSQVESSELVVLVNVSWTKGLLTRTFSAKSIIRDWQ